MVCKITPIFPRLLALVAMPACWAAAGGNAEEQSPAIRILMDAPGPGYYEIKSQAAQAAQAGPAYTPQPVLSYQPGDIRAAKLVPAEDGTSQIELTFQPKAVAQIKEYIEFNKAKPIRVEVGDYTLPLDTGKTLPWTGVVWLEARPTEKARTILRTLEQMNKRNP
jgi:hypothetical protein